MILASISPLGVVAIYGTAAIVALFLAAWGAWCLIVAAINFVQDGEKYDAR